MVLNFVVPRRGRCAGCSREHSRRVSLGLCGIVMVALASSTLPRSARADIDPASGIDFVRIGSVGNAAYQADNPNAFVHNRGSVGYEYSIGRLEVTTAEWVPFFNAAFRLPVDQRIPHIVAPSFWGAAGSQGNWTVPAGNERRPVGDISWRMAAIYCNWLHNGRGTTREAFMSGAYDVSTFRFESGVPNLRFTDQQAHSPDARYWIPTFDELFKASHYDPNGNGSGQARWWAYNNTSDTAPVYGPPGVLVNGVLAQANAGWDSADYPGRSPFTVQLGAYPTVQSPWGLLDVAGGTHEWTETIHATSNGERYRVFDGSFWSQDSGQALIDDGVSRGGAEFPHVPTLEFGFRVASSIPAPGMSAAGLCLVFVSCARRKRRPTSCTCQRSCFFPL